MDIIEIDGTDVVIELKMWELEQLAEIARLAEIAIATNDLHVSDAPPYYQGREDLSLVAGLWKSLLRVVFMQAEHSTGYSVSRYHQLSYLAGRDKRRAKAARQLAKAAFPGIHEELKAYRKREKARRASTAYAVGAETFVQRKPVVEYAPRTAPRPTDQQSGELKGEALEQLTGSEQVNPEQLTTSEQVMGDAAPSEGGVV